MRSAPPPPARANLATAEPRQAHRDPTQPPSSSPSRPAHSAHSASPGPSRCRIAASADPGAGASAPTARHRACTTSACVTAASAGRGSTAAERLAFRASSRGVGIERGGEGSAADACSKPPGSSSGRCGDPTYIHHDCRRTSAARSRPSPMPGPPGIEAAPSGGAQCDNKMPHDSVPSAPRRAGVNRRHAPVHAFHRANSAELGRD
jgi:hypothetical protein